MIKTQSKRLLAQRWVLGCVIGILWLAHLVTAIWFVTHSELIEARVIERHQHLLPSKRHGWECLKVAHMDQAGKRLVTTIQYNATDAPESDVVPLWQARSGIISLGAASLAEAFWVEVWMLYACIYLGVLALAAKAMPRVKRWLKQRSIVDRSRNKEEHSPSKQK